MLDSTVLLQSCLRTCKCIVAPRSFAIRLQPASHGTLVAGLMSVEDDGQRAMIHSVERTDLINGLDPIEG